MAEVNVERRRQQQPRGGLTRLPTRANWWSRWPTGFLAPNPFGLNHRWFDIDRPFGRAWWPEIASVETWSPSLEVLEREDNMVVRADLPGIKQDDVKVEVTDGDLLIQGERKCEHEETEEGYFRSECSYDSFSRRIPLPEGAKTDQARAQFNNGVLEASIPVPETNIKHYKIPIEAGEGSSFAT